MNSLAGICQNVLHLRARTGNCHRCLELYGISFGGGPQQTGVMNTSPSHHLQFDSKMTPDQLGRDCSSMRSESRLVSYAQNTCMPGQLRYYGLHMLKIQFAAAVRVRHILQHSTNGVQSKGNKCALVRKQDVAPALRTEQRDFLLVTWRLNRWGGNGAWRHPQTGAPTRPRPC